jgi:hypothetical protein
MKETPIHTNSYTAAELYELNDKQICFDIDLESDMVDTGSWTLKYILERPGTPELPTTASPLTEIATNVETGEEIIMEVPRPWHPTEETPTDFHIRMESTIQIVESPIAVFIVTDKPVYLPEQKIQFKIAVIDRDLKAVNEDNFSGIEQIIIQNPEDSTIFKLENPKLDKFGQISDFYTLLKEPVLGLWNIEVKTKNDKTFSAEFKVDKYVLPKFSVTVDALESEDLYYKSQSVSYKVCAKYTHGNKFFGSVDWKLTVTDESCSEKWDWRNRIPGPMEPKEVDRSTLFLESYDAIDLEDDGCATVIIDDLIDMTENIKPPHPDRCYSYNPGSLNFTATVSERNTDETKTVNDDSVDFTLDRYQIINTPIEYIFEDNTDYFELKTKIIDSETGLPAENIDIILKSKQAEWIFDARYGKKLEDITSEASKPYCYQYADSLEECEKEHWYQQKTNKNGEIIWKFTIGITTSKTADTWYSYYNGEFDAENDIFKFGCAVLEITP